MDQQKDRIVSILSPDRYPLVDTADHDEPLLYNSQRALDL
jgi:hypothetical protein